MTVRAASAMTVRDMRMLNWDDGDSLRMRRFARFISQTSAPEHIPFERLNRLRSSPRGDPGPRAPASRVWVPAFAGTNGRAQRFQPTGDPAPGCPTNATDYKHSGRT